VGGEGYNTNQADTTEYIRLVDSIKKNGMVPAIQVAVGRPGTSQELNLSTTASAKALLRSLNNSSSTYVKYGS
jgi:hypothetical protein